MTSASPSSAADGSSEAADRVDDAILAEVMRVVPPGAAVLAGYLARCLIIFLPQIR